MRLEFHYGPTGFGHMSERVTVSRFEDIAEPWRSYAVAMDAGKDEKGYWKLEGFGRREQMSYEDVFYGANPKTVVWYLFEYELWKAGGLKDE